MDSNESVYEAERIEFGHARIGHSGTGAAAPEQRHRSSGTGAGGRHRNVAHRQTSLVLSNIFPFIS
ncbi:unnamed protein product [Ectocarpus sp. CCAP 1310/34]|nr:unnamed protein product [Ectocarpus sp. CCAP 1310/34]